LLRLLWRRGRLRLLAFRTLAGRDDRMQDCAFHARHEFHYTHLADITDKAVDDVIAEIAVSHLAAAETKTRLDLVAALQKLDGLILFGLVVVLIHGDRELDFLDDDNLLLLLGGAFGLFLLVEKAAVVLNAADRGNGVRRNLDEIEPALASDFERFERSKDSHLFAVFVDHADFAGANAIVDADKRLSRAFIECDGTSSKVVVRLAPESFRRSNGARERTLSIALV